MLMERTEVWSDSATVVWSLLIFLNLYKTSDMLVSLLTTGVVFYYYYYYFFIDFRDVSVFNKEV